MEFLTENVPEVEVPAPSVKEERKRCTFYMEKKKKICSQQPVKDRDFCVSHGGAEGRERIVCPIDSSHEIFKNHLEHHLLNCPRAMEMAALAKHAYYKKDANTGPTIVSPAEASAPQPQHIEDIIRLIELAYETYVGDIPTQQMNPPEFDALHDRNTSAGAEFRLARHTLQQASIVGHMKHRGMVTEGSTYTYVEMGAGRGKLGAALGKTYPDCVEQIIMVERANTRHLADKDIRSLDKCMHRARVDIRDLWLDGLPIASNSDVVLMGKHVCGVATDMSLRSLKASSSTDFNLKGVAIAMCCHHACNWQDYVGQKFLLKCGFSSADFRLLSRITGWQPSVQGLSENSRATLDARVARKVEAGVNDDATKAAVISEEDNKIRNGPVLSPERRMQIGRMAKRVLDAGRLEYLQESLGWEAELVYYCDPSISPENCLIIGRPQPNT